MKQQKLSDAPVTTMTYDMVVKDDANINQEIKDFLADYGWIYTIPEQIVESYNGANRRTVKDAPIPNTTAWKANITPEEACAEFKQAIVAYDAHHSNDREKKFARGNVFAVCGNVYKALKIE